MKSAIYLLLPLATTIVNLMFVVAVVTYFPHSADALEDQNMLQQ
jgi:hypothetical protein